MRQDLAAATVVVATLVGKRQMQRQTPAAQATNSSAMQSRKLYVVEISSSFHVPQHQAPRGCRAPDAPGSPSDRQSRGSLLRSQASQLAAKQGAPCSSASALLPWRVLLCSTVLCNAHGSLGCCAWRATAVLGCAYPGLLACPVPARRQAYARRTTVSVLSRTHPESDCHAPGAQETHMCAAAAR